MKKEEINLTSKLKNNPEDTHNFTDAKGISYSILILGRGETLFYRENNKALICEISARFSKLNISSIKNWDNRSKIKKIERDKIAISIAKHYELAYKDKLGYCEK